MRQYEILPLCGDIESDSGNHIYILRARGQYFQNKFCFGIRIPLTHPP